MKKKKRKRVRFTEEAHDWQPIDEEPNIVRKAEAVANAGCSLAFAACVVLFMVAFLIHEAGRSVSTVNRQHCIAFINWKSCENDQYTGGGQSWDDSFTTDNDWNWRWGTDQDIENNGGYLCVNVDC